MRIITTEYTGGWVTQSSAETVAEAATLLREAQEHKSLRGAGKIEICTIGDRVVLTETIYRQAKYCV